MKVILHTIQHGSRGFELYGPGIGIDTSARLSLPIARQETFDAWLKAAFPNRKHIYRLELVGERGDLLRGFEVETKHHSKPPTHVRPEQYVVECIPYLDDTAGGYLNGTPTWDAYYYDVSRTCVRYREFLEEVEEPIPAEALSLLDGWWIADWQVTVDLLGDEHWTCFRNPPASSGPTT